jgi:cell division protein FtsI/penicillin-binding protein 2
LRNVNSPISFRLLLLCALVLSGAVSTDYQAQANAGTALEPVIAQQMAGKPGAVVVLDVTSGKIRAQSNLQVAAQRVTAPGSVVKPFVLLALLQSGKLDPEQHLVCHRTLTLAGKHMDCTHSPAITNLDAADAIAYSCNSYFAQAAARLSPSELAETFQHAGFTARTGLAQNRADADAEATGKVVHAGDLPHLQLQALGDWGVEVTPLELLAAYRNLALHRLKNDLAVAAPVFDGLERSVQYGMAHTDTDPVGISVAGKTGTAAGTATPQTHGFFLGYAPADKPEIVLVVYLEHGRGSDAAAIAAPIFTAYEQERSPAR